MQPRFSWREIGFRTCFASRGAQSPLSRLIEGALLLFPRQWAGARRQGMKGPAEPASVALARKTTAMVGLAIEEKRPLQNFWFPAGCAYTVVESEPEKMLGTNKVVRPNTEKVPCQARIQTPVGP